MILLTGYFYLDHILLHSLWELSQITVNPYLKVELFTIYLIFQNLNLMFYFSIYVFYYFSK